MARVIVFGGANVDHVVQVDRRPFLGETMLGSDLRLHPGGKGANQAAASAKAGAATHFIGCVGSDDNGRYLLDSLQRASVDITAVAVRERPTGIAMILVTPDGENSIVVSPGANGTVDIPLARNASVQWTESDVVVLNLEIPIETVEYVAKHAAARGARVIVNAAPAAQLRPELLGLCDPLIVNEHEAATILGADEPANFEHLARSLRAAGAQSVVITLGAAGAVVADAEGVDLLPARSVTAIDTTGAGDAFVGGAASQLATKNTNLREAVRFAMAMAAISVQRDGAQTSYPSRLEVEEDLARG